MRLVVKGWAAPAVCLGVALGLAALNPQASSAQAQPGAPTYTKDVAPILNKNCASCHRPGEMGPMPLLTFQQVRPYAAAVNRRSAGRLHAAVACRSARRNVP